MSPRIKEERFQKPVQLTGDKFVEIVKDRSKRGQKLPGGGTWNNSYSKEYMKDTGKSPPVNLRLTRRSMKGMRSTPSGKRKASIRGSDKLRKHDQGTAKGGKRRQMFPDNVKQVPQQITNYILKQVKKVLSGEGQQDD